MLITSVSIEGCASNGLISPCVRSFRVNKSKSSMMVEMKKQIGTVVL